MNTPTPNLADAMMERLASHRASRAERSRTLWAMSTAEREAAMWRGELTGAQLWEWARRRPEEVPLIDGEWAFIAVLTPEVKELEELEQPLVATAGAAPAEPTKTAPTATTQKTSAPVKEKP